jgi:pimeloyl-ACP methyl ester carboxylesterase
VAHKKISAGRVVLSAVLIVTGIYVVCLIGLTLAQRRLMYFPCKASRADLQAAADKAGFKRWENSKQEVIGWFRKSRREKAERSILLLHGNAGCAPSWFHYADYFQAVEPTDFFILEYPGYGGRSGSPSQTNILRAADEALKNIPRNCQVFLVGESLGTGPACYLAGTYSQSIRGAFLVAPYTSITAVAKKHIPLFPIKLMLRDKYPAEEWLTHYDGPLAVLLAGKDRTVPSELGRELFEHYRGPKKLWVRQGASHDDVHDPGAALCREVVDFWNANSR